jgi:hypothetical protein
MRPIVGGPVYPQIPVKWIIDPRRELAHPVHEGIGLLAHVRKIVVPAPGTM